MQIRGIIQSADLDEPDAGGEGIEMIVRVQGVGPGQPRKLIIPYDLLLRDESLDPEAIRGRGFEAEIAEDGSQRWVVSRIAFASRVLRPPE